jgi:simple sugar transport system permease protein/ribose transport system permease protein
VTAGVEPGPPAAEARAALLTAERTDRRHLVVPVSVALAVLALVAFGQLNQPEFLTYANVQTVVRSASLIGIVALGTTFVTISGSYFSLSVQQTAMFCAIGFCAINSWGWGLGAALVLTLLLAAALGLVQGGVVAAGANPIITTLGAGAAIYGLAAVLTESKVVRIGSDAAEWLGRGRPLGIPTQSYAFVLLTLLAALVLARTRFGRLIVLCGSNRDAARACGLPVGLATISAFVIASVSAGIAGIFLAAQIGQGRVDQFPDLNLDVIAAVLVGGTAIQGGEGSMVRTTLGTLFIALLTNLMLLLGYAYGPRILLQGIFVVLGVAAFHLLRGRGA